MWLRRQDGSVWFVSNADVLAKCLKEGFVLCEAPGAATSAAPTPAPAVPEPTELVRARDARNAAAAHETNNAARKAFGVKK